MRGAEATTVPHEQSLADIERRVAGDGAGPDDIDARIAAQLGVPPDYYFAYLLVWGAIERTPRAAAVPA